MYHKKMYILFYLMLKLHIDKKFKITNRNVTTTITMIKIQIFLIIYHEYNLTKLTQV